ncbi:hypothetical protein Lser_V15G21816 [Lactuca serriola]
MKHESFIVQISPTQSLLSMVNGILDENISRKSGEIPHRVACLMRKLVDEPEKGTVVEKLTEANLRDCNHLKELFYVSEDVEGQIIYLEPHETAMVIDFCMHLLQLYSSHNIVSYSS